MCEHGLGIVTIYSDLFQPEATWPTISLIFDRLRLCEWQKRWLARCSCDNCMYYVTYMLWCIVQKTCESCGAEQAVPVLSALPVISASLAAPLTAPAAQGHIAHTNLTWPILILHDSLSYSETPLTLHKTHFPALQIYCSIRASKLQFNIAGLCIPSGKQPFSGKKNLVRSCLLYQSRTILKHNV